MKYYVIDWEFKVITSHLTREETEKYLDEEWDEGIKEDSVAVIKGEQLQVNLPKPAEIVEKKKNEKK